MNEDWFHYQTTQYMYTSMVHSQYQCEKLTAQVNNRVPTNGIVRVSHNIERVTTLEDGSVVFKPPPNSFADGTLDVC